MSWFRRFGWIFLKSVKRLWAATIVSSNLKSYESKIDILNVRYGSCLTRVMCLRQFRILVFQMAVWLRFIDNNPDNEWLIHDGKIWFFISSRACDKEKILSTREESNLRPSVSALRCSTTEPQRLYQHVNSVVNNSNDIMTSCIFTLYFTNNYNSLLSISSK